MTSMNPLEHHHPHGDDEPMQLDLLDPAQQSLADAMRISFLILKIVMLLAVVVYIFTGAFQVEPQKVAARLRFGKIVGQGNDRVITEGFHMALPYPIEQVIKVPISPQSFDLLNEFFFEIRESDKLKEYDEMETRALNPEKDGSLLTGDANIVHAKWTVVYRIRRKHDDSLDYDAVVDFLANVGDLNRAERIVRNVAEQSLVHAVAQMTADELIKGRNYEHSAIKYATQSLDAIGSGLEITAIAIKDDPTVPLSVREDFRAVTNAESKKAEEIDKARQYREMVLGDTAGQAHASLWAMIHAYELARAAVDPVRSDEVLGIIDRAMTELNTGPQHGNITIGGEVSIMINTAKADRTQVVEEVKAEANTFVKLLAEYNKNPRIVIDRIRQDAMERILSGDVETFYLPSDAKPWFDLNRDPDIAKQREKDQIIKEQEKRAHTDQ